MADNCKPKYKNLSLISSFSEQKYLTVQLMEQACMNDEYLKQFVDRLEYLTPPAVRKRYNPILVDESQSYGHNIGSYDGQDSQVVFSDKTSDDIPFDFFDMSCVDVNKSDCSWDSYEDENGVVHSRAVVPQNFTPAVVTSDENFSTKHPDWGSVINSYWYVGFDKNKPYYVKPKWVKNPKHEKIPSVARAQTFRCTKSGLLESVTLALQNTGDMGSSWASPLYVQIWGTKEKTRKKTVWNKKRKCSEYVFTTNIPAGSTAQRYKKDTTNTKKGKKYNGATYYKDNAGTYIIATEKIMVPKGDIYKPLAEATYQPEKTTPGNFSFVFDKAPQVEEDKSYAIVMFSPLSHPDHAPRIGGWGRNCNTRKYADGDAFLSEDNCRTWKRYGKNDDTLTKEEYKFGRYTPQDFAFECKIVNYSESEAYMNYDVGADYYLYLKPILTNPIKSFHLSGSVTGETVSDHNLGVEVIFEYSINGKTWYPISMGEEKQFNEYLDKDKPIILFIRAKLSTTEPTLSPCVENVTVHLTLAPAREMYVRTHFYDAKTSPMLGASLWGRIFAPFELSHVTDELKCSVELIEKKQSTEHFDIYSVSDLDLLLEKVDSEGNKILDSSKITNKSDDERCQYLLDHISVIKALKQENVYIKPYILNESTHYLSFDGGLDEEDNQIISGLQLTNSPAYPIQSCVLKPFDNAPEQALGEWYDFKVDYDTDEIILNPTFVDGEKAEVSLSEWLPTGSLVVDYNHVFLQDLTSEEVGTRIDEDTGAVEEGLILDYFKQDFVIGDEEVENRRVSLKCVPVDPIRSVILNKDSENEKLLYEGIDFDVDYENKLLVFRITDDYHQTSILTVGDMLTVVYTPALEDTSIAIGYRAMRKKTNYQCVIKPNYFEYKV